MALRFDARHAVRHEYSHKPTTHGKNYGNFLFSGGLTFQIGGQGSGAMKQADSDGDGVIDSLDQCSGSPAGIAVDANGCPKDSDSDGVIDAVDQCPDSLAGAQVDAQGCVPVVAAAVVVIADADSDGVVDADDKCPNTPTEVPVNERGCPADTDQDGVFDVDDNCPDTELGKNVDADGCEIDYAAMEELKLEITFASNSSVIDPKFNSELQEAADFIKAHPGKKLLVEGHTDTTGSAASNERMSQKRADTVRWVLVRDYGVNKANLTAKGFGEKNPIEDNATQAGRTANRRVVIRLVD
jgi:OOP family OmpA-OmpF porin